MYTPALDYTISTVTEVETSAFFTGSDSSEDCPELVSTARTAAAISKWKNGVASLKRAVLSDTPSVPRVREG